MVGTDEDRSCPGVSGGRGEDDLSILRLNPALDDFEDFADLLDLLDLEEFDRCSRAASWSVRNWLYVAGTAERGREASDVLALSRRLPTELELLKGRLPLSRSDVSDLKGVGVVASSEYAGEIGDLAWPSRDIERLRRSRDGLWLRFLRSSDDLWTELRLEEVSDTDIWLVWGEGGMIVTLGFILESSSRS